MNNEKMKRGIGKVFMKGSVGAKSNNAGGKFVSPNRIIASKNNQELLRNVNKDKSDGIKLNGVFSDSVQNVPKAQNVRNMEDIEEPVGTVNGITLAWPDANYLPYEEEDSVRSYQKLKQDPSEKMRSYMSGLVREVPPPGFDTVIMTPIYMYKRGPNTTEESLEEVEKGVAAGLIKKSIFLNGPVIGWGNPEMVYFGNNQFSDEQEELQTPQKSEVETGTPLTTTTAELVTSAKRVKISKIVEIKTPEGLIKTEELKKTPSRAWLTYRQNRVRLKKEKIRRNEERHNRNVELIPNPAYAIFCNDKTREDITRNFYQLLYKFVKGVVTIIVYKTGLYSRNYFHWIEVAGVQVPTFPPDVDGNCGYLDQISKAILSCLKTKQIDGVVLHVLGINSKGYKMTLHKYLLKVVNTDFVQEKPRKHVSVEELIPTAETEFGTALRALTESEEILTSSCPWFTRWKISVGTTNNEDEDATNPLMKSPNDELDFPWEKRRTVGQARKMKILFPKRKLRPKFFISEHLRLMRNQPFKSPSNVLSPSTNGDNNIGYSKQSPCPSVEQWSYCSSSEDEDVFSGDLGSMRSTADQSNLSSVAKSAEIDLKSLAVLSPVKNIEDLNQTRTNNYGKPIRLLRPVIDTISPGFNLVLSIVRVDFTPAASVFTEQRIAQADKCERNFRQYGSEYPDKDMKEAFGS